MNFTSALNAVIALVGTLVTAVLIPYIKTKVSAERLKTLASAVGYAVKAAEQLYKGLGGMGNLKKAHVLAYLTEKGYIKDIGSVSTEIDNLIESAVFELKS